MGTFVGLIRLISDPLSAHFADRGVNRKRLLNSVVFLSFAMLFVVWRLPPSSYRVFLLSISFVLFYGFRWQMLTLAEQICGSTLEKNHFSLRQIRVFLTSVLIAIGIFLFNSPLTVWIKSATFLLAFSLYLYKMKTPSSRTFDRLDYSHIRLWGGLSFIFVLPVFYFFQRTLASEDLYVAVVPMMILAVFATGITTLFFPETPSSCPSVPPLLPKEGRKRGEKRESTPFPLKELFLSFRSVLLFLLMAGLLKGTTTMYNNFGSISFNAMGFTSSEIGSLYAFENLSNLLFFFLFSRWVRVHDPIKTYLFCSLVMALRWGLTLVFQENPVAVMLIQGLGGITYAVAHATIISYISTRVPARISTTTLALYGAFSYGFGSFFLIFLGYLVEIHPSWGWGFMSFVALLTSVGFFLLAKRETSFKTELI